MTGIAIDARDIHLSYKVFRKSSVREEMIQILRRKDTGRVKKIDALNGVSFTIYQGENIGIIGSNGSGKSTLLRVMAQILEPDSGQLVLGSSSISLLALGAGFQDGLSGLENIYINGLLLGMDRKQLTQKLDEIIEFSGLGDFIYEPVKSYSSGMVSRLAFSISATIEPDILLIDELLGVGDEEFREKSQQRIMEMIRAERTVVIVSHNIRQIKELSNRVLWLEKGKVMAFGQPEEVIEQYTARSRAAKPVTP